MSTIEQFSKDDSGAWVAQLSCGHRQHIRHEPPRWSAPWVESDEQRLARLGSTIQCVFCTMPRLPKGVLKYKQTKVFDQANTPESLQKNHSTKADVWARIVLLTGKLTYHLDGAGSWPLSPDVAGIVPPQAPHRVILVGPVQFCVEFYR